MLLLEIILLVRAWKKGWGAKALLPMAAGLGLMLVIGIALGAGGATEVKITPLGFMVDLGVIAALGIMLFPRGSGSTQIAFDCVRAPAWVTISAQIQDRLILTACRQHNSTALPGEV